MAAARRFAMGLALVLFLCSSWFPSSEAFIELNFGSGEGVGGLIQWVGALGPWAWVEFCNGEDCTV